MEIMANPRIDDKIHEQLKDIAKKKDKKIQDVYHEALNNYIQNINQEIILADSKLDQQLNERMKKFEDRFMSVLNRIGMDNAIGMLGLIHLMDHVFKDKDRNGIYSGLRDEARQYYSKPYQNRK